MSRPDKNPEEFVEKTIGMVEDYKVEPAVVDKDLLDLEALINPPKGTNILPIHQAFADEQGRLNTIEVATLLYAQALSVATSYGLKDPASDKFWESVPRLLAMAEGLVSRDKD